MVNVNAVRGGLRFQRQHIPHREIALVVFLNRIDQFAGDGVNANRAFFRQITKLQTPLVARADARTGAFTGTESDIRIRHDVYILQFTFCRFLVKLRSLCGELIFVAGIKRLAREKEKHVAVAGIFRGLAGRHFELHFVHRIDAAAGLKDVNFFGEIPLAIAQRRIRFIDVPVQLLAGLGVKHAKIAHDVRERGVGGIFELAAGQRVVFGETQFDVAGIRFRAQVDRRDRDLISKIRAGLIDFPTAAARVEIDLIVLHENFDAVKHRVKILAVQAGALVNRIILKRCGIRRAVAQHAGSFAADAAIDIIDLITARIDRRPCGIAQRYRAGNERRHRQIRKHRVTRRKRDGARFEIRNRIHRWISEFAAGGELNFILLIIADEQRIDKLHVNTAGGVAGHALHIAIIQFRPDVTGGQRPRNHHRRVDIKSKLSGQRVAVDRALRFRRRNLQCVVAVVIRNDSIKVALAVDDVIRIDIRMHQAGVVAKIVAYAAAAISDRRKTGILVNEIILRRHTAVVAQRF